jgi:hypothetical protein
MPGIEIKGRSKIANYRHGGITKKPTHPDDIRPEQDIRRSHRNSATRVPRPGQGSRLRRRLRRFGGGRTNLLEELGRVEGERSNPNRRAEISRVHSELNRGYAKGGRAGFSMAGRVLKDAKKAMDLITHEVPTGPHTDVRRRKINPSFGNRDVESGRTKERKRKQKIMGMGWKNVAKRMVGHKEGGRAGEYQKTFGGKRIPKKGPVIRERQTPPSPTVRAPEAQGGRVGLKKGGSDKNWIQKATKGMVKTKPCTGKKFGSKSCPPGSKRYNLAKTFKKMGRERKAKG